jgi:predicted site-specific integrase-resolvase
MREQLIKWVALEEIMNVKEASRVLGIKYQTAKSIMRRYVKTGKIDRCNKILKISVTNAPIIKEIELPKPKPKL